MDWDLEQLACKGSLRAPPEGCQLGVLGPGNNSQLLDTKRPPSSGAPGPAAPHDRVPKTVLSPKTYLKPARRSRLGQHAADIRIDSFNGSRKVQRPTSELKTHNPQTENLFTGPSPKVPVRQSGNDRLPNGLAKSPFQRPRPRGAPLAEHQNTLESHLRWPDCTFSRLSTRLPAQNSQPTHGSKSRQNPRRDRPRGDPVVSDLTLP